MSGFIIILWIDFGIYLLPHSFVILALLYTGWVTWINETVKRYESVSILVIYGFQEILVFDMVQIITMLTQNDGSHFNPDHIWVMILSGQTTCTHMVECDSFNDLS
jgi:hypothetical protein